MPRRIAAIACIASLLGACAPQYAVRTTVDRAASRTFDVTQVRVKGGAAEQKAEDQKVLEEALNEVLNFCLPRLSGFEKKAADQAELAFWLSLSGLLAGTVAAPALTAAAAQANASWIAGLSGWAGATNFASQVLRTSGLSGATIAETRNSIIRNLKDHIAVASDGSRTFEERRNALMKARAECVVYEISVPTVPDITPN